MAHAAILLLMLEAGTADLVPPSACRAAPKISSDLHAGRPITPSLGVKRTSREQHEMAVKVPPCRIRNESLLPTLTPRGQAIFVPERLWQNDQRSCGSLSLR